MHEDRHILNSQRLRYEAYSNFATAINRCGTADEVAAILRSHSKFIIDLYFMRLVFVHRYERLIIEVHKGKYAVYQHANLSPTDVSEFEDWALQQHVPFMFTQTEIHSHPLLAGSFYDQDKINVLSGVPVYEDEGNYTIITIADKKPAVSLELTFRFLRNMAETVEARLSQLLLIKNLEDKNTELQEKNEEILALNENLEDIVISRNLELIEANTELQQLFHSTSHDFRAPLTNISSIVEIAKDLTDDAEILMLFDGCRQVVSKLENLLYKLLSITIKSMEDNVKEISFAELTNKVFDKFSPQIKAKNIRTRFTQNLHPPFVSDKLVLFNILENLVENSINYSCKHNPFIEVLVSSSDKGLLLSCIDNGDGIEESIRHKIYNMYYRGHAASPGSGLGLYVVRKLVKSLNGDIRLHSIPGKVTNFTVFLPFTEPEVVILKKGM